MNRKMKIAISIIIVLFCVSKMVMWSRGKLQVVFKQQPAVITSDKYKSEILFPKSMEEVKRAGSGSAVGVNSKGNVIYLHRAGYEYENKKVISQATILEVDSKTGQVVKQFGQGIFKSPHGLSIDNEDNIWVTDVMTNKVYKLNSEGKLLNTYGTDYPFYLEAFFKIRNKLPNFPTTKNQYIFARPTDIVVDSKGGFIVSDGYRNKRIVKFDRYGKVIWEINKAGVGNGELNLPHGLAVDNRDNIYVADRSNARVQVFSKDGNWLKTFDKPEIGRPFGLEIGEDGYLYVADGGDTLYGKEENPRSQLVRMDLEGNVIERWGKWGSEVGELKVPHDIAVDTFGNIYVSELNNKRLQKFYIERN